MARLLLSIFLIVLGANVLAAYPPVLVEVIPQAPVVTDTAKYAYVPKVVTGDVVAVQVQGGVVNVRIYGVSAIAGPWGKKAKDWLQWRVEKKDCAVEVMGKDKHGRHLVRLYQGGTDVGLQMVALGLVRTDTPTDSALSFIETAAKKRGIGMWEKR